MYSVGDYVVYGTTGVCEIKEIGPIDLPGVSKDRVYYTMSPFYSRGSKIFTPTDSKKVVLRPVLTKAEAMDLIDHVIEVDTLWITNEKKREQEYKDLLRRCDCEELVKIIKTIYMRKCSRQAEGKKVTACDEKYFHQAEESLYGELAVSLDMPKEEVKKYIAEKVEHLETK